MVSKFIAVKDRNAVDIIISLDALGIKYDYYGHDEIWSVIEIRGFNSASSNQRTYDNALKMVGVVQ